MTRRLLFLVFVTAMSMAGCSRGVKPPTAPEKGGGPLKGATRAEGLAAGDTIALPFGGGTEFRVVVSTPTNPDTTSPSWKWSWILDNEANDVLLLNQPATATGENFVVVQGSVGGSPIAGTNIGYRVTNTCTIQVDTMTVTRIDTVLQGVVPIKFKRIVPREIEATATVYHLTHTIAGVIVSKSDSLQAEFRNNDQDRTLLRAGPFSLGGTSTIERHRPVGQDYVGSILFKTSIEYSARNTSDLRSQVPTFTVRATSPKTELVLIAPNGRWPVTSHEKLVLQWSGARDSAFIDTSAGGSTVSHTAFVDIFLTDYAGNSVHLVALDNGRYDLSVEQLRTLKPGLIRVLSRRLETVGFPSVAVGPPRVNLTLNFVIESHATFYLQP